MTLASLKKESPMQNTMIDATVLELLASRICHDLISPVGAVNNGVEFLEDMGPDAGDEAIALISMSANAAAAKLQVFRLAYGAGGRDPNIKPWDVHKTFNDLIGADGKVKQEWDARAVFADVELPEGFCKILTSTLMLATECMPKGGAIGVTHDAATHETRVIAAGPDANPRTQVEDALAMALDPADLDPRLVHPFATGILGRQYGLDITIEKKGDGVVTFLIKNA